MTAPAVVPLSRYQHGAWVPGWAVVFTQDGRPRVVWRPTRDRARRLAARITRRRSRDAF